VVTNAASELAPVPKVGEDIFLSITLYGRVLEIEGVIAGANDDVVELRFAAPLQVPPSTVALGKVVRLGHNGTSERAQVVAITVGEFVSIVVRTLTSLQAIDGRRSFARVPVAPVETLVVVAPPLRMQALHASVIDLSGGGCGLISPRTLPNGVRAWLQLRRPRSQQAVPVEAEIRSTHPLGYFSHAGVMFVGIDNAARETLIHELVEAERLWRTEMGLRV
jgi:hypothetical protein